jgi:hypothetical protein
VVREIFSAWACASSGCASKPNTVMPTAPAIPLLKNARLDSSIAAFQNKKVEIVNAYRRQKEALEKR